MKIEQVAKMNTPALVAFYNSHADAQGYKPVKKFADRKTAEKRVIALIEKLEAVAAAEEAAKDQPKASPLQGVLAAMYNAPKVPDSMANLPATRHEISDEEKGGAAPVEKAQKVRASNSEGIAISWANKDVRDARLTRNGVQVEFEGATQQFKSVREAFRHYRLPDSKHIRFRGALKAAKSMDFENNGKTYKFTIID